MKAAEGILLYRTDGNTDPMIVVLSRTTDDATELVDDAATVEMDVLHPAGNFQITGTARGDASGTFLFATISIPAGKSSLKFDIDVTEGGAKATYARGSIITAAKREQA